MINRILLELYCLKDADSNSELDRPQYCQSAINKPSYFCLLKNCPFLDYTTCENTLCYINEESEMEEGISLGGEMLNGDDFDHLIKRWKECSLNAIDDAYERHMKMISKK